MISVNGISSFSVFFSVRLCFISIIIEVSVISEIVVSGLVM